jgi:hypothetical protein
MTMWDTKRYTKDYSGPRYGGRMSDQLAQLRHARENDILDEMTQGESIDRWAIEHDSYDNQRSTEETARNTFDPHYRLPRLT